MTEEHIYTVSEITREIKLLLEENIPYLWIEGEISNFSLHSSGHLYFTLKDEHSQLRCVMFRNQAEKLSLLPENGVKVVACGNITVYEKAGQYQLNVFILQPKGIGELALAFEQLKAKLSREGLFDPSHKKLLPRFSQRIGLVTSPTGAAIRDIIKIIHRRWPLAQLILNPVQVQGKGAAEQIAKAIEEFNQFGEVDLLIVGRGGGSLEDLWAFNEEIVARAIYNSKIPVVSAVGHEIDFTIADFVADVRAPTPSAAAEIVVPNREDILRQFSSLDSRLQLALSKSLILVKEKWQRVISSYGFRRFLDLLPEYQQQLDENLNRLERSLTLKVNLEKQILKELKTKLAALNPLSILERGYSVCRKVPEYLIVKKASQLKVDDQVEIQFSQGKAKCSVEEIK
ncbi:MAG: exodeoxyribonuclease VII large subunit [Candidatus Edwardsbacteria bacterium]